MKGGDGGGGERWRRRRRGKGGGREAEAEHRSDVDTEAARVWRKETVGLCEREVLSSHQSKQGLPYHIIGTEQRVNIIFVHRNWYGTA